VRVGLSHQPQVTHPLVRALTFLVCAYVCVCKGRVGGYVCVSMCMKALYKGIGGKTRIFSSCLLLHYAA